MQFRLIEPPHTNVQRTFSSYRVRLVAEEGGFLALPKLALESLKTGSGGGGAGPPPLLPPWLVALVAALEGLVVVAPLAPATALVELCLLDLPSDVRNPDSSSICRTKT